MNEAPGPINFTMFLTMFGEKLNGTDPEDVIRNAFACFDEEGTGERSFLSETDVKIRVHFEYSCHVLCHVFFALTYPNCCFGFTSRWSSICFHGIKNYIVFTGVIQEEYLRELLTTMGDRFTDEDVDELFREAPIDKKGNFNYVAFTRILKHGAKDKDD